MPKVNLFQNAKIVAPPPKPKSNDDKDVIRLKGLEDYAKIDLLVKQLMAIKETLAQDLKGAMKVQFLKVPENYEGYDGAASASCELRKRATNSPLKAAEIEELTKAEIPIGEMIETQEAFIFNPKYSSDPKYTKLFAKVSEKIQEVKDLPEDFIQLQPESKKSVVTDETFDTVKGDEKLLAQFIDTVGVMAIKPKFEEQPNIKAVLQYAEQFLVEEEDEQKPVVAQVKAKNKKVN